jgi:glutamate racemase
VLAFLILYNKTKHTMSTEPGQPIGIFDSGVGGLTVANAIRQILPNENLIYFGDTAHLPYGDKSSETITYYSKRITEYLLSRGCKTIVIACNTASAVAYESIIELVDNRAIVVDVINPVVDFIIAAPSIKKVGIIGTKATINSGTYLKKINGLNANIRVASLPTPLLVPMIEEGFIFDDISNAIIRSYLSKEELSDIDALILACTHYPIIKNQINKFYNFRVEVIDSSKIVAGYLKNILRERDLLNNNNVTDNKFFISDYTEYFKEISRLFFEENIKIGKLNFWS